MFFTETTNIAFFHHLYLPKQNKNTSSVSQISFHLEKRSTSFHFFTSDIWKKYLLLYFKTVL